MRVEVTPVPCLSDNYAYLVRCTATGRCAVVDPSEGPPVLEALARAGISTPDALWATHHHHDHVGGIAALRAVYGAALGVYGHAREHARIPGLSTPLEHGARFALGALTVRALHVPGHTLGALAFVVDEAQVFTGDTLFVAGCGRLFEGTAAVMHHSLNETLGALDASVRMYPGHEYAEKNLRFAAMVEPGNTAVKQRAAEVTARRARGAPCVGDTLGDERATNPFLRAAVSAEVRAFAVARGAGASDPVAVLAAVRAARDGF